MYKRQAKDRPQVKYRQLYLPKKSSPGEGAYTWLELPDGCRRRLSLEERTNPSLLPPDSRVFRADNLTSQSGVEKTKYPVEYEGRVFRPTKGVWKTSEQGMRELVRQRRLILIGNTLSYVRYFDDFPVQAINNMWEDTAIAGFADPKLYAVQTNKKVIERCVLMTTDPGDLVLDPCLLYTSDAADDLLCVDLGGRRIIKKKKYIKIENNIHSK